MTDNPETTGAAIIASALARAEFAAYLADRLLMFPLAPQPGDTLEQHAECLRASYARVIVEALNMDPASARRPPVM
ncbi:hypothetical protein UFOVP747_31 [uncultured Caudovirales phage]|uniref:Uncharacterized protein n=1 Tax=uncultured Caudovirales phage TaxID=2100421 RepID=A0A6J5NBF5_9CAUD|nr:hypothetical protein UFOVP675_68 [uncultured Caudovirales phage]CAB5225454.1 hypothetical protein UFOVP747_31 [uncultured Caudovirales phage]